MKKLARRSLKGICNPQHTTRHTFPITMILGIVGLLAFANAQAQHRFEVNTKKLGAEIQPTMWGIFFEDINFGADGGLYAELVENRSFEFPQPFMGWDVFGNVALRDSAPAFPRNPHYVTLSYAGHKEKRTGLDNHGFFGIGLQEGMDYHFSVWSRGNGQLRIELVGNDHGVIDNKKITIDGTEWKKYEVTLTAKKTDAKAFLRIFHDKGGAIDLDHISLFPADNWHGLRADLVKDLKDLHPGIFRFPGGCIVEGTQLSSRYQWKHSVGPTENRPLNENRWNYTFAHRMFPNYFQTYGLGFYELFLLSEHIGAEPLPILNVGLACQYQNDEKDAKSVHADVNQLDEYIQDVLDLIEFANGDTTSQWGRLRAEMGHPAPFHLKYVGIGNEQWGPLYAERLEQFMKPVRQRHPEIKIVGSAGPSPDDSDDQQFSYNWEQMRRLKVDLVDEHYYRDQQWFLSQANRYDHYDRKGPKVFAGEYACHVKASTEKDKRRTPTGMNTWEAALCEAALMTGLERNADVVHMCTYAPLFAHVEGWQWRPDLIWMDNLRTLRTPNYYVQQLFAQNKGTRVLPISAHHPSPTTQSLPPKEGTGEGGTLYASAVYDEPTRTYINKVVNVSALPQEIVITFKGIKTLSTCELTTLSANAPSAINTFDSPNCVQITTHSLQPVSNSSETGTYLSKNTLHLIIPPHSIVMIHSK